MKNISETITYITEIERKNNRDKKILNINLFYNNEYSKKYGNISSQN